MKRIVLSEKNLKELVEFKSTEIDGIKLEYNTMKVSGGIDTICRGKIHTQGEVQMVLQDIGFARINAILNKSY